jgi:hypothetical protein
MKFEETHGFAPLPRGRFALIVCNHRFAKEHWLAATEAATDTWIKQYLPKAVKVF